MAHSNGPTLRGARIVESFQKFKILHEIESQKEEHQRKILTFEAPKPDMLQGIQVSVQHIHA